MSRSTANWLFISALIFLAILVGKPSPTLSSPALDYMYDLLGLGLAVVGLVIRLVSRDWKTVYANGKLVRTGPYSVVRNPMYIGSLLMGTGLCVIWGSIPFLALFVASFLLVHISIARREERFLRAKWPQKYEEYAKSVPSWLPSPTRALDLLKTGRLRRSFTVKSVLREFDTICGTLAAASLLEGFSDFAMEGWTIAHSELIICICIAVCVSVLWVAVSKLTRPSNPMPDPNG